MTSVCKTLTCLRVNKASCCKRINALKKSEREHLSALYEQEWFAKGNHMKVETNMLPASHLCLRFHLSVILALPAVLSSSSSKNTFSFMQFFTTQNTISQITLFSLLLSLSIYIHILPDSPFSLEAVRKDPFQRDPSLLTKTEKVSRHQHNHN